MYTAFVALCLISVFFRSLHLPFVLFQLPWSLSPVFFRYEVGGVYYLSFSNLHYVTTDVCPQEKNKTWETQHASIPSSKCGVSSKICLLFLLRCHIVSFCIFSGVFIYLLEGCSVRSLLHYTRNQNLGGIL